MPSLNWIGRKAVEKHHEDVPYHLLRCDSSRSVGDPGSGNLLIQGDNLVALKALLPYYAGKVKCIYIDPPYNTGNEKWIYNDNANSPEIKEWLGRVVGGETEDMCRHDKWLCMMYPRIKLLRQMLTMDGVIFVSIDDCELHHLRVILGEVFGPHNFLATLVWEKGKKGDSKFFSGTHEYIIVFARDKNELVRRKTKWRRKKPGVDVVLQHYESLRAELGHNHEAIRRAMVDWYKNLPKGHPAKSHKHYNWSDDRGLYFPDNFHGPDDGRENRPRYDIIHPLTKKPCKKPSTGWRWEEATTLKALAETPARIHFGPDESVIPCRKSYLIEVDEEPFNTVFYKDGRAATLEVERMVGPGAFAFPKDATIIRDLVEMVTTEGDIVMDSFAGSGTTGEAVLRLGADSAKQLRFVLVELEEKIASEVTVPRLTKVIEECKAVSSAGGEDRPGFRFCTLSADPLFDSDGRIQTGVSFSELARHVFFSETGEPLPKTNNGRSPLLGVVGETAVYLLYNGILGDKRNGGGNVLTRAVLENLPQHDGQKVIYGTGCRLSKDRLIRERIEFRQIPYEVKVK